MRKRKKEITETNTSTAKRQSTTRPVQQCSIEVKATRWLEGNGGIPIFLQRKRPSVDSGSRLKGGKRERDGRKFYGNQQQSLCREVQERFRYLPV